MTYPTEGHNTRTDVWKSANDHHYAASDFPQPERSTEEHGDWLPQKLVLLASINEAADRKLSQYLRTAAVELEIRAYLAESRAKRITELEQTIRILKEGTHAIRN